LDTLQEDGITIPSRDPAVRIGVSDGGLTSIPPKPDSGLAPSDSSLVGLTVDPARSSRESCQIKP
ncbi:MAG TPA: hypothetical protein VGB31_05765, partial [Myxococcota bacterium]